MKIWVDGQCFQTGSNVRGIGRYVANFLKAVKQVEPETELIISLNGNMKEETVAARNYLEVAVPGCEIAVWYGLTPDGEFFRGYCLERMTDEHILAAHINQINPDIALSPSPFEGFGDRANPFIKTKEVKALSACIFHDAIPYRYPEIYLVEENARKLYFRRFDEIGNFDLVLCNSHFTEQEYRDIYQQTNAVTIGAGLSESFQELVDAWSYDAESMGAQLGKYALYVGGMDWRKNVPYLVRAMARLAACMSGEFKLVLAGDAHPDLIAPLREMWTARGLDEANLISTGWIPDYTLVDLYKNAQVTVQPSRMEGFGLGALEAMACESLFLSAAGGAVAEVVGNDKVLFDPDVPPTLTALLSRSLNDPTFTEQHISKGNERLKRFSWQKSAEIALKSLREAMAAQGHAEISQSPAQSSARQRLIIDVTSTAQSPVLSGIQRVMFNLAEAMQAQDSEQGPATVLSYCRDTAGWYEVPRLSKDSVSLSPTNRLHFSPQDTYLLLDSSWTFTEGQKVRLLDAMVMGQEVIHGIHDIGPLTMSAMTDAGMPPAFRRWFEFILGYSTGIVCVSRAVADEIYELLHAIALPRPMKIGYFRLGANFADVPANPESLDFVKQAPTFLMVGTVEPRKGHYVALQAFEQLWSNGVDVNLLIIGKAGWDTKLLQQMVGSHSELGKRLHWRTGVSDEGLRAAYELADALVMTSYLEGFGLPVVEAGRFGCPVILSDIPVFREVGKGAPWASYFERGNAGELARAVCDFLDEMPPRGQPGAADWPLWSQSAQELKDVLFGGKWHKYYEPLERLPNVKLSDIGNTKIQAPLKTEAEIQHTMKVIEGPFLSDDGTHLRTVVALRNQSKAIWSSDPQEGKGLDVNLGYHLYDERDHCISYDNPRTRIPFVIVPNQEIYLPIRIETDWLTKGVSRATLELVQEGVRWFGNQVSIDLLNPTLTDKGEDAIATGGEFNPDLINLVMFRGPFGEDITNEHHYLFLVMNGSSQPLKYLSDEDTPTLSVLLTDGNEISSAGVWPITHYDVIAPNSFGLLCVYATAKRVEETGMLQVIIQQDELDLTWQVDLETGDVTQMPVPLSEKPKQAETSADLWGQLTSQSLYEQDLTLPITSDAKTQALTRGFHAKESTHTWMRGMEGEIDFSGLLPKLSLLTEVELFCAPYDELSEPVELTLWVGGVKLETRTMSRNFMSYTFSVSSEAAEMFLSSNHLQLVCNQAQMEKDGGRSLSICLGQVRLAYKTPQLERESVPHLSQVSA